MEWSRHRLSIIIAGVLVVIPLLVFMAGFVPFMDCPYRAWEKSNHTDTMGPNGAFRVCKNGRVSFIYWWKHQRAMEKENPRTW